MYMHGVIATTSNGHLSYGRTWTFKKTTDHMKVHKTSVIPGDKWQANDSVSRVRLQCSHSIMCMELLHLSLHSMLLNIKVGDATGQVFLALTAPCGSICHVVA